MIKPTIKDLGRRVISQPNEDFLGYLVEWDGALATIIIERVSDRAASFNAVGDRHSIPRSVLEFCETMPEASEPD
jgi:hypothetical protein